MGAFYGKLGGASRSWDRWLLGFFLMGSLGDAVAVAQMKSLLRGDLKSQ
jgi:hypothetical protein